MKKRTAAKPRTVKQGMAALPWNTLLADTLNFDIIYPRGTRVLEIHYGSSAQTILLATNNPGAKFVSHDISRYPADNIKKLLSRAKLRNVETSAGPLSSLPWKSGSFDHVFVSFALEAVKDLKATAAHLFSLIKPGGTITAIETDYGSCCFHPVTREATTAWHAMLRVRQDKCEHPYIGRQLFPLLKSAGFGYVNISQRTMYLDSRRSIQLGRFMHSTILPMIRASRRAAALKKFIAARNFTRGLRDIERIADIPEGTFFLTFFRAVAGK